MSRLKSSAHFAAYQRGYSDREIGLPSDGRWSDAASQRAYLNGYSAAKLAEQSPL